MHAILGVGNAEAGKSIKAFILHFGVSPCPIQVLTANAFDLPHLSLPYLLCLITFSVDVDSQSLARRRFSFFAILSYFILVKLVDEQSAKPW